MKVFLIKSALFALILLLFVVAGSYNYNFGRSDYMAAIIDKHNRLEKLQGEKIIFAGGSNLSLGLNSKKIQDSLKIPVVNLGLNAGLGVDFILKELEHSIKPGDIAVISIEYFLSVDGSPYHMANAVSYFPEASSYVNISNRTALDELKVFTELKIEKIKSNKNLITSFFKDKDDAAFAFNRESFNEYGDCIGHLDKPPFLYRADGGRMQYRYWDGIPRLNEFYRIAKSRNVKVYFMYPCFMRSEYILNKDIIDLLDKDLRKDLLFPVLGSPEDFVFDDNLFYETVYHLLREGREKRTDKVIEILKQNNIYSGIQ